MPARPSNLLDRHAGTGRLVRVTRRFPGSSPISGIVLASSPTLALLRVFCDFARDGLTIVRHADVEAVRAGPHERFWLAMLRTAGILGDISTRPPIDLSGIPAAIRSASRAYGHLILEVEDGAEPVQDFYIGSVRSLRAGNITMRYFNALGVWAEKDARILSREITRIQCDAPYITHFVDHMTKLGRIPSRPSPRPRSRPPA